MELLQYNTSRKYLGLKEYGRHIQKMVDYLMTLEDRDKRNQQAGVVIELMGVLNPHLKNVEDFTHMLWDHLFAMSDFKLDVDSPYPIPQKENYKLKGEPMKYPRRYPKFAHLGKNLELIIDKALNEPDPERKVEFSNSIAYYMKLTYSTWHKELVHDDTIRTELNALTNGKLEFNSTTPRIRHNSKQVIFEDEEFNRSTSQNGSLNAPPARKQNNFGNNRGGDTRDARSNNNGRSGSRTDGRNGGTNNKGGGSKNGKNNSSNGRGGGDASRNFKKRF